MNEKRNINFNGKEYLEYLKWKDGKKWKPKKLKESHMWFVISGLAFLLLIGLLAEIMAPDPQPVKYTWEGILMFLAICGGIGWVIHGTGFLLVKR